MVAIQAICTINPQKPNLTQRFVRRSKNGLHPSRPQTLFKSINNSLYFVILIFLMKASNSIKSY